MKLVALPPHNLTFKERSLPHHMIPQFSHYHGKKSSHWTDQLATENQSQVNLLNGNAFYIWLKLIVDKTIPWLQIQSTLKHSPQILYNKGLQTIAQPQNHFLKGLRNNISHYVCMNVCTMTLNILAVSDLTPESNGSCTDSSTNI